MPNHEDVNLVDLGKCIARNVARKLYSPVYWPEALWYLFPELAEGPEAMSVLVRTLGTVQRQSHPCGLWRRGVEPRRWRQPSV